ncbi:MAG TPA: SURF1 family protein [Burkholderiales bacterium]
MTSLNDGMTRLRALVVPTLAALVLVPLFCGLGFWQLRRAEEKEALQAEYDRRAAAPPITLQGAPVAVEEVQYARVRARGVYETEYQVLWDNRIHNGVPGYHVLTPFRIENSDTRVLVNRGWVPAPPSRAELPDIDAPPAPVDISGTAVAPRVDFLLGELDPLTRTRPTVWQQIDLERYAQQVEWPLQPIVVLLDPQSPGGYVREWARLDAGIAVHRGYAFQWFALAATAIVVYVVLVVRWYRRNSPMRNRT